MRIHISIVVFTLAMILVLFRKGSTSSVENLQENLSALQTELKGVQEDLSSLKAKAEMPMPKVGETFHLLITHEFNKQLVSAKPASEEQWFVGYVLEEERFVLFHHIGFSVIGSDFIVRVRNINGDKTTTVITDDAEEEALRKKFKIEFEPISWKTYDSSQ